MSAVFLSSVGSPGGHDTLCPPRLARSRRLTTPLVDDADIFSCRFVTFFGTTASNPKLPPSCPSRKETSSVSTPREASAGSSPPSSSQTTTTNLSRPVSRGSSRSGTSLARLSSLRAPLALSLCLPYLFRRSACFLSHLLMSSFELSIPFSTLMVPFGLSIHVLIAPSPFPPLPPGCACSPFPFRSIPFNLIGNALLSLFLPSAPHLKQEHQIASRDSNRRSSAGTSTGTFRARRSSSAERAVLRLSICSGDRCDQFGEGKDGFG